VVHTIQTVILIYYYRDGTLQVDMLLLALNRVSTGLAQVDSGV
jgi:hypothetical protein